MTERSREDHAVSDSGGTMTRLTAPPRAVSPDLALLEPLRRTAYDDPVRPAGRAPYFEPGDLLTWHYGHSVDALVVVRDDERGLVSWLPSGSERLVAAPRDGPGIRDRPLAERYALALAGDYELEVARWLGPGVLRVAPTGVPWSVWYFRDEEGGSFEGHYLNLELVHQRPADGSRRVHSRDLTLDLWVADGDTWLKDADELEAAVAAGWYSADQASVIRDLAERARRELVEPTAWPLDDGWETWRPPPAWDRPLSLPTNVVDTARSRPT